MSIENIEKDIICPITQDFLEDPIRVPCCQKAFSRKSLQEYFSNYSREHKCPMCNSEIDIVVADLPQDILLVSIVDSYRDKVTITPVKPHNWECKITPVSSCGDMVKLDMSLDNAQFSVSPSLFIAVLDRSGSMTGKPHEQVYTALKHIISLSKNSSLVKLVIITYGSDANIITTPEEYVICGGTNFVAAFNKIDEVLLSYQRNSQIKTATIAFLTDGQDGSGRCDRLVPEFKEMLQNRWGDNPLSVHTIGFSMYCSQELLESMREAGNVPGMFRYAEPSDDDDTLCNKLTGIFEVSSKSSQVPIRLTINGKTMEISLNIDSNKYGQYTTWLPLEEKYVVTVDTEYDNDVFIPVEKEKVSTKVFEQWLAKLGDEIAVELVGMAKENISQDLRKLKASLLKQRIETILQHTTNNVLSQRLEFLQKELENIDLGLTVNLGRLSDMRFASKFKEKIRQEQKIKTISAPPKKEQKMLDKEAYNEPELRKYSRNNFYAYRNKLQENICSESFNNLSESMEKLIEESTMEDIMYKDIDGNNSLHLATYCGHSKIVKKILECFPELDVNIPNRNNETPVTLAVKKRGFHFTLCELISYGAKIPRPKSLQRFCVERGYPRTAEILSNFSTSDDGNIEVDRSMTFDYIKFIYNKQKVKGFDEEISHKYLDAFLCHGIQSLKFIEEILEEQKILPTIEMLCTHCIPIKPDAPDTEDYITLSKLLLKYNPSLINQKTPEDEYTPLFTAANRGSLPHVKLFLERGADIDIPNEKGNTPLWIAAYRRYPCIIEFLVDNGADINYPNKKGNIPIYGVCERGNVKVAEQLLSAGSDITFINNNGDTLILLCCRNGKEEVLKFFLDYVDENFVNYKAGIDGFNAIMASAEMDRAECIRVLFEYGIDLNQKTDNDNEILPGATPLHIATYYNRLDAIKMLVKLGADLDSQDFNGYTPIHLGVIQGNCEAIKILRKGGGRVDIEDNSGNRPQSYCRNKPEIRKYMVDPALDILTKLAENLFDKGDTKKACTILEKYSGTPCCSKPSTSFNIMGDDGVTPFVKAVIHNNYDVVKTMYKLGMDDSDAHFWAIVTNNPRIKKLLQLEEVPEQYRDFISVYNKNIDVLWLGRLRSTNRVSQSSVCGRMETLINCVVYDDLYFARKQYYSKLLEFKEKPKVRAKVTKELTEQELFNAKICTINTLRSGTTTLSPRQLFAIALYTSSDSISRVMSNYIATCSIPDDHTKNYVKYLYSGLEKLPMYKGEVYIGTNILDRKLYEVGTEFSWPKFTSTTARWKLALENCPTFDGKGKKGTILAVKSRTGRVVSSCSQTSFESEIVFFPFTKFKVTGWYRGDVIALGQPNIREHSFSWENEEEDIERVKNNNRSLIIQVEEIIS